MRGICNAHDILALDLEITEALKEEMHKNKVYKEAIYNSKHKFENKKILVVDNGTGFIPYLFVKVGEADKVFVLERDDQQKKEVEDFITLNKIEAKVEVYSNLNQINELLKVDIVASSWIGYQLMDENISTSIKEACRFLADDGFTFPSACSFFTALCALPAKHKEHEVEDLAGMKMKNPKIERPDPKNENVYFVDIKETLLLTDPQNPFVFNYGDGVFKRTDDKRTQNDDNFSVDLTPNNKQAISEGICVWYAVNFLPGESNPVLSSGPAVNKPDHVLLKPQVKIQDIHLDTVKKVNLEFKKEANNFKITYKL